MVPKTFRKGREGEVGSDVEQQPVHFIVVFEGTKNTRRNETGKRKGRKGRKGSPFYSLESQVGCRFFCPLLLLFLSFTSLYPSLLDLPVVNKEV